MFRKIIILLVVSSFLVLSADADSVAGELRIGWAKADITPQKPAFIGVMHYARLSTGVQDPVTATALAVESAGNDKVIMISCDLRSIRPEFKGGIIAKLAETLPEISADKILVNATHTHSSAPFANPESFGLKSGDFDAISDQQYREYAIPLIAGAAEDAWKNRKPGGISFGLVHAVTSHNRIANYSSGKSKMYGKTDKPDFIHMEGYEDSSVNVLSTWDKEGKLTGLVINIANPSQVSADSTEISADFWDDVRKEFRSRVGEGVFILPQCSAAGDLSPKVMINSKAEKRMESLMGKNRRQVIAMRIADAICPIIPLMQKDIEYNPVLMQKTEKIDLPVNKLTQDDLDKTAKAGEAEKKKFDELEEAAQKNPELRKDKEWIKKSQVSYFRMNSAKRVLARFEKEKAQTTIPVEVHAVRIGNVAFANNPFELYVDYGLQIKARSKAVQTFLIELSDGAALSGSYLPTERALSGGAYGSTPQQSNVGPAGGQMLVDKTVEMINSMWPEEDK